MSNFLRPEQLETGVGIEGFCCGNAVVDNWACKYSKHARQRGSAVIYAVYCNNRIAGFYTLSAHSIARSDVTGRWFVLNAPEQIPVVLLGMLGVDKRFQRLGLGASLLKDAVINAIKISKLAGAKALVVDSTDEKATSFYAHFGFKMLPGTSRMALKLC